MWTIQIARSPGSTTLAQHDKAPHNRSDNHRDQTPAEIDNTINELIKWLGNTGIDKAFTGFLQQDILAQVVVRQLLNKIDGLQNEVDRAKWTTIALAS